MCRLGQLIRGSSAFDNVFRQQAEGSDASLCGKLAVGPSGGGHSARPSPVRDTFPVLRRSEFADAEVAIKSYGILFTF